MKQFGGFPARVEYTGVPTVFISRLLPEIEDMAELKTTLHLFRLLSGKRGLRFVTRGELAADAGVKDSLSEQALGAGLAASVARGTFLQLTLDVEGKPEDAYFLNGENDRRTVARIRNGEMALAGVKAGKETAAPEKLPDIFTLYATNFILGKI